MPWNDLQLGSSINRCQSWSFGFSGDFGVNTYRIPIITSLPDGSLLALAEGRKHSSADSGPKLLASRRSTNQGITWGNTTFIEDDGDVPDGLNLGTVFVDEEKNRVFILYSYCAHKCVYHTTVLISSDDFGLTWTEPFNLSQQISTSLFLPGPGFGIQVQICYMTSFKLLTEQFSHRYILSVRKSVQPALPVRLFLVRIVILNSLEHQAGD